MANRGIEYTGGSFPSPETFAQQLREVSAQYDPVDKLLALERDMALFEQTHGLVSSEFFRRYQAGTMGDSIEYVRWVGRYKLYQNLKSLLPSQIPL
ncbi:MAG: hypothetical protein KJZ86_10350 [Caldilineaceae bacterium]|nr:hypothetical protein [Caldilineaceae bacterium]HRJ41843.1 hypothetical protein [Caldilineaceae bacterium]